MLALYEGGLAGGGGTFLPDEPTTYLDHRHADVALLIIAPSHCSNVALHLPVNGHVGELAEYQGGVNGQMPNSIA